MDGLSESAPNGSVESTPKDSAPSKESTPDESTSNGPAQDDDRRPPEWALADIVSDLEESTQAMFKENGVNVYNTDTPYIALEDKNSELGHACAYARYFPASNTVILIDVGYGHSIRAPGMRQDTMRMSVVTTLRDLLLRAGISPGD